MTRTSAPSPAPPRASVAETVGIAVDVIVPLVARGLIARRPLVVEAAERMDADRRAVRRMQRVRDRHGPGPVVVRVPRRTVALVVDPDQVRRVLDDSPDPFSTANLEKRVALSNFQPHGVADLRLRPAGATPPAQRAGARHRPARARHGRGHRRQGTRGGGPARRLHSVPAS